MVKTDRALTEVRKWKDQLYHETGHLSAADYLTMVRSEAAAVLKKNRMRLRTLSRSKTVRKIA